MPGIAGIIPKDRSDLEARAIIDLMVKSMRHEPFYNTGAYQDARLGLSVGWVCHEDSFSDCLPIWNEKKDVCLIYHGEDLALEEEIPALKAGGHHFHRGDASPLVHLYEERGVGFLDGLTGAFCGLLADFRTNRVLLFNDRFGLGRLYYHENDRALYFASEAKALLRILPELRDLDWKGLAELFALGCPWENRTVFSNVRLMPCGSMWSLIPGRPTDQGRYFKPEDWEGLPQLEEGAYLERLAHVFPSVLRRHVQGRQSIGISLTGGIDTRMIMAWAPCLPFKLPCYTFSGIYRDSADLKIARKVAAACQQRHEPIRINKDFFAEFPALAKRSVYFSDGAMDVSGSAELYVNRKAREIAPVRLTGNYGDQIIRGVIGFKPLHLRQEIFDDAFSARVDEAALTPVLPEGNPLSFFCAKQVPWHHYPRHALESSQLTMRSPFLDNELVSLAFQAPDACRDLKASLQFIRQGDRSLARIPTDRGVVMSSPPFRGMARRWILTLTKKGEYAFDYGMPPWLARLDKALSAIRMEKLFLGRHKYYHFRIWYRHELKKYIQSIILDPRTLQRPYLKGRNLETMVQAHIAGMDNYTQEIHWVLTSELLQRHLIEKS